MRGHIRPREVKGAKSLAGPEDLPKLLLGSVLPEEDLISDRFRLGPGAGEGLKATRSASDCVVRITERHDPAPPHPSLVGKLNEDGRGGDVGHPTPRDKEDERGATERPIRGDDEVRGPLVEFQRFDQEPPQAVACT